jgi:hypothetical protein
LLGSPLLLLRLLLLLMCLLCVMLLCGWMLQRQVVRGCRLLFSRDAQEGCLCCISAPAGVFQCPHKSATNAPCLEHPERCQAGIQLWSTLLIWLCFGERR